MRFHIPGIPHTVTNKRFLSCAYTQKVLKLCAMLDKLGHEVFHYGCEGSEVVCAEHVDIVTESARSRFYPNDFETRQFSSDINDSFHQDFHARAAEEIKKRQRPRDFLLCAWGWGHRPIAQRLDPSLLVVESGIGYPDTFAPYRVFESHTWMSHVYGRTNVVNPSWYDCVIPNFFDPADFEFRREKEDWFLYLGRLVQRKGLNIAVDVTREIGAKLIIAGQGTLKNEAEGLDIHAPHVEFVGFADLRKRRDLLARARGVFVPTHYHEPFGGVSIEANMSGTPVITTDWSVFAENVLHGVTGYRCRTFEQFCWAARNIGDLSPDACRRWAADNFSMDRVAAMYEEYFRMLYDLWDEGWYQRRPERSELDWLRRSFPPLDSTPRE